MDLSQVDVEWVDQEDGLGRRATAGAVAGVAFEAVAPVRRFSSYRGRSSNTGWYWAETTRSLVGFESWLERDRAMLLDYDPRVTGLASQPFRLTWLGARRRISHTPDYFARLEDGAGVVVDVRPAGRIGPEDAVKFSATEAICQRMGNWSYELVHEPDPVVMANVRWLAGYRHPRYRVAAVAQRLLPTFSDPVDLRAGVDDVGDPIMVLPVLFHLLWHGDLAADLRIPLSDSTVVVQAEVHRG